MFSRETRAKTLGFSTLLTDRHLEQHAKWQELSSVLVVIREKCRYFWEKLAIPKVSAVPL